MSIFGNPVMMGGGSSDIVPKIITQNGVYNASSDNADGYNPVTVNVSSGGIPSGTTPPDPSTGSDGDLYVQTFPVASNVNFVEYLESSGTQYINTGIAVTLGLGAYVKGISRGVTAWCMGARNASSITSSSIALAASFSSATTHYCTKAFGSSHEIYSLNVASGATYEDEITVKDVFGVYYALQGSQSGGSVRSASTRLTSGSNNFAIVLFGINTSGTIAPASSIALSRVVFFDFGVPIHDYLPCLDGNGVACMWDNVAGQYVYNDGTGNFTYGSSVTPDELEPILYQKVNGTWEVVS